jgi:hypothetical protein
LSPRAFGPLDAKVFPFRDEAPRPRGSDGTDARASAIRKRCQPFTCLEKTGGARNERPKKRHAARGNDRRLRARTLRPAPQKKKRGQEAVGVGVSP